MKILYILAIELDCDGGPKTHVVEILKQLQKLGNNVLLLCPPFDNKRLKLPVNVQFYRFFGYSFLRRIASYLFMFLALLRCIPKFKPKVAYVRQMPYNPLLYIGCKIFKLPFILELNGIFEEDMEHTGSSKLSISIHKIIEKREFISSIGLICTSPVLKKKICRRHTNVVKKIFSVPNGVNSNLFRPLNKMKCRVKLGFDPQKKYVGYVGSFSHVHNPDKGIRSFRKVAARIPEAKLIMVGDGPLKKKCKKIAEEYKLSDRIIFTGPVNYDDVPTYINCFDIALDLSSELSLQRAGVIAFKFNEYLACGRPIISQYLCTKDFDRFSSFVKMVHVNDELDLADSIIELLENPADCAIMQNKSLSYVNENISWKRTALLSLNFIREMITKTEDKVRAI
jgi:glycosyltransferase involved in cell wall biosynthesis